MGNMAQASERPGGKYTNNIQMRDHHIYSDEPLALGSADIGPTPFELLCAALASCTSITLRMYIDRKKWPVDHIAVDVTHHKIQNEDGLQTDIFTRKVKITGDVTSEQAGRILVIANKCPVHRTLERSSHIETQMG